MEDVGLGDNITSEEEEEEEEEEEVDSLHRADDTWSRYCSLRLVIHLRAAVPDSPSSSRRCAK